MKSQVHLTPIKTNSPDWMDTRARWGALPTSTKFTGGGKPKLVLECVGNRIKSMGRLDTSNSS